MDMDHDKCDIWMLESVEAVQLAAAQNLQDSGVAIPSPATSETSLTILNPIGRFGLPLDWDYQETLACTFESAENKYNFQLPKVFVECVSFLKNHTEEEGLFRKAGSVSRQKQIQLALEEGRNISEDANVHDVAGVLKKYLRMLPDPLLTKHLTPLFEDCLTLSVNKQPQALLLACLLLPSQNLQCLCVLMELLSRVSGRQSDSLMSSNNLGIIMAPNLLHIPSTTPQEMAASGQALLAHTKIVTQLIEHSSAIGRVSSELLTRAPAVESEWAGQEGSPSPELEHNKKHKKHRSGSLSGMMLGLGSRLKSKGSSALLGEHKRNSTMKKRGKSHENLLTRPTGKMKQSLLSNVEELRRSLHCGSGPSRHRAPPRPQIIRPSSTQFSFNPPLVLDSTSDAPSDQALQADANTRIHPAITSGPSDSQATECFSHSSVTISPIATDRHAHAELDFKFSPPMDCSSSSLSHSSSSSDLDQAFIKTPFPGTDSPNLLDKIKSEMKLRQPFQVPGIANLSRVNESYKRAVSGCIPQSSIRSYRLVDKKSSVYTVVADENNTNNCPPLALSFTSEIESNKSLPLEPKPSDSLQIPDDCTSPSITKTLKSPASNRLSSPSVKTPASTGSRRLSVDKLGVPMKPVTTSHAMRKRYDYSATLGIAMGENLIQVRGECKSEQQVSPLSKMHNHSACLGMTGLERDTLRRASKRVYPKKSGESSKKSKAALQRLCDLHSPSGQGTTQDSGSGALGTSSPLNCSGSALIKILDDNLEENHRKHGEGRVWDSSQLTRRPLNHSVSQSVFNNELDRVSSSLRKAPFKKVPWPNHQHLTQKTRATVYEVESSKRKDTASKSEEASGKENPLKEWVL